MGESLKVTKVKCCKVCGELDTSKLIVMQGYIINMCKSCKAAKKKQWHKDNSGHVKNYKAQYRAENKEQIAEYNKVYRAENRDKLLEGLVIWRQANPDKVNKYSAKRRATIARSLPSLEGELEELNSFIIEEAYSLSRLRTDQTGIQWHVDHIVPLNGKKVCGLHVGINLQAIPAKQNLYKSNKFEG